MATSKDFIAKMSAITEHIGAIRKTKKPGSTVSYAFRGIDDVMNALNPQLAEQKITITPRILSHSLQRVETEKKGTEGKYMKISHIATVHLALVFSDGEHEEIADEIAMSEDFSDKAYTQATSMAYKYIILRKFSIPTEDLEDPDGKAAVHTEPVKREAPAAEPLPSPKGETKAEAPAKGLNKAKVKKPLTELDEQKNFTKEWNNTVKAISSGKVDMDTVKGAYELTPEQEEKLTKLVPKTPTTT